jgi:hypothetical protein
MLPQEKFFFPPSRFVAIRGVCIISLVDPIGVIIFIGDFVRNTWIGWVCSGSIPAKPFLCSCWADERTWTLWIGQTNETCGSNLLVLEEA